MVTAALELVARGFPLLPCHAPNSNGTCSCWNRDCDSIGKHPRTMHGYRDATTDPEAIRRWWRMWPDANLGIATGNGLVVVDVDPRSSGYESLERLEAEHGEIVTLTVRTGGGGVHLYLRSRGDLPNRTIAPGVEVKSKGLLVIAPPSLHAEGARYGWVNPGEAMRVVPDWAVDLIVPRRPPNRRVHDPVDAGTPARRKYVEVAIRNECIDLAHTMEDNRNNRLNEAAFSLARFVATGEANPDKLVEALTLAASHAGLSDWEITGTIKSAFGSRGAFL